MTRGLKKGIILAGGSGTRLYPATTATCKQLLPLYDKPMVYYPLATLMQIGIRDILIISTPEHTPQFQKFLGDGGFLGLKIKYEIQKRPEGIAQAIIIGEKFLGDDNFALILGDNVFYGTFDFEREASDFDTGAIIFGYRVNDAQRYGVIEFGDDDSVLSIVEKPALPKSDYAVTGLYFYDRQAIEIARSLKPSARGELEITDVNNAYLQRGQLKAIKLGQGFAWLDSGTFDSILDAANFIATIEKRQGIKIACIEELAWRKGYISRPQIVDLIKNMPENEYQRYLKRIVGET